MNRSASFGRELNLVGALGILFGMTAGAQTLPVAPPVAATPPATVSTNLQDYSQGFRAFISMGLPDTSKAKYVKLDYYGGGMQDMLLYRLQEIQMSGNAWLISENKVGKSVLISSVGRTMELVDQKTFMKNQEAEARSNAVVAKAAADGKGSGKQPVIIQPRRANDFSQTGSWNPMDLSRDLVKATAFVDKKIKAKAAGSREMRYDSFLQSDEAPGMLFMFAAFAWQNGKVQEANALAGSLFTLVGDSRKVIVGALNVMASSQLAATSDTFRKTGDWNLYQAEVAGLVKKYPSGWRQAGAARLLADRLQTRAAMAEPPAVTGEGLEAEALKLAAALAMETNQAVMHGWYGELWILPPAKAMRGMKDDSAIGRIKARGIKSIPLLIAMVPDETFCPLRRNDVGLPINMSSSGNDAQKTEAERAQLFYSRMDRPVTRGEIARAMLAPLCRRDENARNNGEEIPQEEAIENARQAYATLKPLAPSALATHFLKNGDQRQKQAAVNYLLQNDFETNAPAIEAYLLTPPSEEPGGGMMMGHDSGIVQQYVQKRGEQAAEFVEKYAAMREKIELPAGMANNANYVKMMEKQAKNEIKALRAMVKKQELSEVVSDLEKSGDDNGGAMAVYAMLGRQPPAKAVPALLAVAVKTTNLAVRARIVQMMPMLRYSGMQESMQAEMSQAGADGMAAAMKKLAEKNKLNIVTNAAEWKILLADTRAMPLGRMYSGGAYEMTIADMAATSIETLYGDTSLMEQYGRSGSAANLRPDAMMKIMRARAAARLEAKAEDQLPKFPSADDVTADRRKAIEADVMKAAPAALGTIIDKLTDAESLYLAEVAGENETIMKAMAPLSRRIASVKTAPALPAVEAVRLQKLAGTTVSTNVIAEMLAICKRQMTNGAAFAVALSSGGLGKGLSLTMTPVDESMRNMYGAGFMSMSSGKGGKRRGMIMGTLMNGQNHGNGIWMVHLPVLVTPTGTVAAVSDDSEDNADTQMDSMERSFESQQEQFQTAVEAFCKSDEPLGQNSSVTFTGFIPPPPKAKNKKADGDEDEEGAGMMDAM